MRRKKMIPKREGSKQNGATGFPPPCSGAGKDGGGERERNVAFPENPVKMATEKQMKKGRHPIKVRLGIDFGTTRTVVARVESGNYPLVTFETEWGDGQEWYPSLVAGKEARRVFGWEAWSKHSEEEWQKIRSLKRYLSQANPETCLQVGGENVQILGLLIEYLSALRRDLLERSNLHLRVPAVLEVMIGVPANANNNQRFLTLEAFRRAGFEILGLINEPSAAGVEYAFRYRKQASERRKEFLMVYDLGGGTFDLSVIQMHDLRHRVMTTAGIEHLGGDDFDAILAALALEQAGLDPQDRSNFWLLEECREKKENLKPNTRKMHIDLSRFLEEDREVTVTVADFYGRIRPMIEQTVAAVEDIIGRPSLNDASADWFQSAGLYLVGGAAELPLIAQILRERYGRRLRKSPYPRAATAIGLAIGADEMTGFSLRDRFTRHFGVWREEEEGRRISFDPIFPKDTLLPSKGDPPLVQSRRYQPAHNIGHFRYLECSHIDEQGQPLGNLTAWDEIRFPFEPELSGANGWEKTSIRRFESPRGVQAEEVYTCDSQGIVKVTLINHSTGFRKSYQLRHGA
jgi:molecular chaperone DnaK (HSP70)